MNRVGTRTKAAEVVRRYFAAWPARDRAAAEAVVADDFHFTSPLDNRLDRKAEVLTVVGSQVREVEVYFGWDVPHPAPEGGFLEQEDET